MGYLLNYYNDRFFEIINNNYFVHLHNKVELANKVFLNNH